MLIKRKHMIPPVCLHICFKLHDMLQNAPLPFHATWGPLHDNAPGLSGSVCGMDIHLDNQMHLEYHPLDGYVPFFCQESDVESQKAMPLYKGEVDYYIFVQMNPVQPSIPDTSPIPVHTYDEQLPSHVK